MPPEPSCWRHACHCKKAQGICSSIRLPNRPLPTSYGLIIMSCSGNELSNPSPSCLRSPPKPRQKKQAFPQSAASVCKPLNPGMPVYTLECSSTELQGNSGQEQAGSSGSNIAARLLHPLPRCLFEGDSIRSSRVGTRKSNWRTQTCAGERYSSLLQPVVAKSMLPSKRSRCSKLAECFHLQADKRE